MSSKTRAVEIAESLLAATYSLYQLAQADDVEALEGVLTARQELIDALSKETLDPRAADLLRQVAQVEQRALETLLEGRKAILGEMETARAHRDGARAYRSTG